VPGAESWRFKALSPGETTISLEYIREWEADPLPADTAEFRIVIE
jgi:predicted secreted protein